jgi:hypothetical protein
MSAEPNKELILAIAAAHTAHQVKAALASHGASELVGLLQSLNGISDNIDKACIIDFCLRHGGVSFKNAFRYIGAAQTNRCSLCRRPGHNKNHCCFC